MTIRKCAVSDLDAVLPMMAEHARYESYGETFAIDRPALSKLGFELHPPAYQMLIDEGITGEVHGYALYFIQWFTFRNRPLLYLNDLVVSSAQRRQGVAGRLMTALCLEARLQKCFRIKWGVAASNVGAIAFYNSLGAVREEDKLYMYLDEARWFPRT